jgi:poly(hydroxyalkanoate) depolymerase family esterase
MEPRIQRGMDEALRLTLAGRLVDATATIQRTLGGVPAWADHPSAGLATAIDAGQDTPQRRLSRAGWSSGPPAASPLDLTSPAGVVGPVRPARSLRGAGSEPAGLQLPGRFLECSYTNAAGTRRYRLYVPSGCAGQAVPLVVMLHGCTQDADQAAAGTRLNALAEASPCLVAYPEQTAAANQSRCWNWFSPLHQHRDRGEPSIIAGITRQVMERYAVDARRVYVAGMSAGGAMASIMAATYPDLYAAVGVHSGLAHGAAHDLPSAFEAMRTGGPEIQQRGPRTAVPVIVFHGDRDTTVNPSNAEQVLMLAVIDDRGRAGAGGHPPQTTRGQVPGGRGYTRVVHRGRDGGVVGERWLVHGGGHAWSGGDPAGSFTDPLGPDASGEMLRFFREHPRPSETS